MLDVQEDCISWGHLPDDLLEDLQQPEIRADKPLADNLQELSRQALRQAVDGSGGNLSQAARRLGISRQTLYRKLRV